MDKERECVVCYDRKVLAEYPDRPVTDACHHEQLVCRDCLQQSISSQSNGKVYNQIDCPTEGCGGRLAYADVQRWADHDTLVRQV